MHAPHPYKPFLRPALFGGFFCLLCIHAWQYYPFIADDALITLRYADRLLQGDGLTWTDGRPVEGYSNLLWLLLAAGLGWLGVDLIDGVRFLGLMCMSAVLFALSRWHGKGLGLGENKAASLFPLAAGMLFFTTAAPIGVWAVGGLEQPLYIALLAFAIPPMVRIIEAEAPRPSTVIWLSFLLACMCITRPDGPLFTAAALFSIYWGRRLSDKSDFAVRDIVLLLVLPGLFYGGQTGFRLWYYGEWVANTALVKISPSTYHFQEGLKYVLGGLSAMAPLSWLAVGLTLLLGWVRPALGIPLLVMGGLWAAYLIFIGGDIFRVYRHILPLTVILAFAITGGLGWLANWMRNDSANERTNDHALPEDESVQQERSSQLNQWGKPEQTFLRPLQRGLVTLLVLAALFVPHAVPYLRGQIEFLGQGHDQTWVWDGRITALLLKQAFGEQQPLMAIGAAGGMAYWSQLPVIDTHGLNDYEIPRIRPQDLGQGWIGHEFGDANYVLSRKPDLMVWHTGRLTNRYRTGRQLREREEYHRLYTVVRVRGVEQPRRRLRTAEPLRRLYTTLRPTSRDNHPPRTHNALIRVRKYDSKLGITVSPAEIQIPSYLLNEYEHTVAYLSQEGRLVIPVSTTQPAAVLIDPTFLFAPQVDSYAQNWQALVVLSSGGIATDITTTVSRQGDALRVELNSPSTEVTEVAAVVLRPPPATSASSVLPPGNN